MTGEEAAVLKEAGEKINSGDEERVVVGINLLVEAGLGEGLDLIVSCLDFPEKKVKIAAARAMGSLQFPRAVPILAAYIERENDPWVRATVAMALGATGDSRALPVLANLLQDENSRVRANSVEALGQIGDPACVNMLTPLLDDPNNRVKANVTMALWQFGGLRMLSVLQRMLKTTENKWHRASAAYALGEIGGFQTMTTLLGSLSDRAPEVRRNVISSLGKMGDIEVIRQLLPHLDDEDPYIRANTVGALSVLTTERDIELMMSKLLDETEPVVLSRAKSTLGKMAETGSLKVFGQLREALFAGKQPIKRVVIELFEKYGTEDLIPDLLDIARRDVSIEIQSAARKAAEAIQTRSENDCF